MKRGSLYKRGAMAGSSDILVLDFPSAYISKLHVKGGKGLTFYVHGVAFAPINSDDYTYDFTRMIQEWLTREMAINRLYQEQKQYEYGGPEWQALEEQRTALNGQNTLWLTFLSSINRLFGVVDMGLVNRLPMTVEEEKKYPQLHGIRLTIPFVSAGEIQLRGPGAASRKVEYEFVEA